MDDLRIDITRALNSHIEHAKTWPGGWVNWRNPLDYSARLLLTLGYLTKGDPIQNGVSVHITNEGKRFLEEGW